MNKDILSLINKYDKERDYCLQKGEFQLAKHFEDTVSHLIKFSNEMDEEKYTKEDLKQTLLDLMKKLQSLIDELDSTEEPNTYHPHPDNPTIMRNPKLKKGSFGEIDLGEFGYSNDIF